MREKHFQALAQPEPDDKLRELFKQRWPGYKKWFLCDGDEARPTYLRSLTKLQEYMPELVPVFRRLEDLFECGDAASRFLMLYCPPGFASGCSQVLWTQEPLALIRNYDYPVSLFDGVMIYSNWTGTKVIAMSDCIWGALDGINEYGLAASLAFGGRNVHGEGFGVTLVVRYILETCKNTEEAIAVLRRVPVHMDYNIALLDREGNHSTVFISPDRGVHATQEKVSANRQSKDEPPLTRSLADTVIREQFLEHRVNSGYESMQSIRHSFVQAPVYRYHEHHRSGTLYTAAYYPQLGAVDYIWPETQWHQSFDSYAERQRTVVYA